MSLGYDKRWRQWLDIRLFTKLFKTFIAFYTFVHGFHHLSLSSKDHKKPKVTTLTALL